MMFRSRQFFSLILLLPLALAACQSPRERGSAPDWWAPAPLGRSEPEGSAPEKGGTPLSSADLTADPGRFKGMSGADAAGLLGAPSFQRHDGEAEIWQYYGPGSACVLDLFLYPDQGLQRIAHAELRTRNGDSPAGCMAAILNGQRG